MQDVCVLCWFPWYVSSMCGMMMKLFFSIGFILMLLCLLAETVAVRTVNRQCSSGLQAVADVAAAIKAGFYDIG